MSSPACFSGQGESRERARQFQGASALRALVVSFPYMKHLGWAAAVAMVMGATVAVADDGPPPPRKELTRRPFMLPGDILRRLRQAPVELSIAGIESLQDVGRGRLADETWKQVVRPIEYPKVVHQNGLITLEPWPRPKAVEGPMTKAEDAFQKQKYEEAAIWYRRTLALAPDYYIAHAYLGDTHLFGREGAREAIAEYDQAIAANPDDYRLYFFRATAHRHLFENEAMLADLRRSLVLKPRNAILIGALQRARGTMGRAEPEVFVPRAFVRKEGDGVSIYADTERPEWLAWAACKALWMVDEQHRQEMLGSTRHGWSTLEELECLGSLMTVYETRKAKGQGPSDDRLEVLHNIIIDGLAPAFVIYELGSRVDPQIVLRLDDSFRLMMARYVEKYVLTDPE